MVFPYRILGHKILSIDIGVMQALRIELRPAVKHPYRLFQARGRGASSSS